ncbi:MAG: OadG family protein [Candidatus Syntrophosphaera sp.]
MRRAPLFLILLLLASLLMAQQTGRENDMDARFQAMSDSLLQFREQEIQSEFGFRDTDTLEDVAAKLDIGDVPKWKEYLEIEPGNEVLDKMTLRRLGISPYKALLAQQYSIYSFTELSSLAELAQLKQLPIKQLRRFAGIDPTDKSHDSQSLQALGKTPEDMMEFEDNFNENELGFGFSITGIGLLIVFSALAITSLVISQLHRLNRKPGEKGNNIRINARGKVKPKPKDMNSDVVAAAITALHLYKQSIEDRRRLLLTFKRAHSNQWHSSGMLNMPNREFTRKRS